MLEKNAHFATSLERVISYLENAVEEARVEDNVDGALAHAGIALAALRSAIENAKNS